MVRKELDQWPNSLSKSYERGEKRIVTMGISTTVIVNHFEAESPGPNITCFGNSPGILSPKISNLERCSQTLASMSRVGSVGDNVLSHVDRLSVRSPGKTPPSTPKYRWRLRSIEFHVSAHDRRERINNQELTVPVGVAFLVCLSQCDTSRATRHPGRQASQERSADHNRRAWR
jgi:hypothetical protein